MTEYTNEVYGKIPIPEPKTILNELLSPSDILRDKQLARFTNIAEKNTDKLRAEMERRKSLDGIKEALENQDFDSLRESYRQIYGYSMITAGKQLLISMLALKGLRVEEEIHIEETVGEWVKRAYQEGGIEGLYDWSTQIDTATQVADEYQVVFESELAKEKNKRSPFFTYGKQKIIKFNPYER